MASLAVWELARMQLKRLLKKEPEAIQQKVVYAVFLILFGMAMQLWMLFCLM